MLIAGAGLGVGLTYLFLNRSRDKRRTEPSNGQGKNYAVDDRGTGQAEAAQILRSLRDRAFDASDEKLALALGRPTEEVKGWDTGGDTIDDDVLMKARGIAMHRGISIE